MFSLIHLCSLWWCTGTDQHKDCPEVVNMDQSPLQTRYCDVTADSEDSWMLWQWMFHIYISWDVHITTINVCVVSVIDSKVTIAVEKLQLQHCGNCSVKACHQPDQQRFWLVFGLQRLLQKTLMDSIHSQFISGTPILELLNFTRDARISSVRETKPKWN